MDDDFDIDFEDLDGTPVPAEAPAHPRAPSARAPRALIVEDDAALARICSRGATRLGMRPHVVWTREEALAAIEDRADPAAFVYVDARILGADADVVAEQIRALHPSVPIVVASADLDDVLEADVVALCKPFDADRFVEAFDAALTEDVARTHRLAASSQVHAVEAAEAAAAEVEAFATAGA